jgi:hypothetical protein
LSDYLLCSDCEQKFSKNGESWVLGNIPRNYGEKFPILDALSAEVPLLADGGTKLYAGAIFAIDSVIRKRLLPPRTARLGWSASSRSSLANLYGFFPCLVFGYNFAMISLMRGSKEPLGKRSFDLTILKVSYTTRRA